MPASDLVHWRGGILKFVQFDYELKNMLLHIFRLEAKASLSGRRKRLVQQEPRACGDGYLHSFSHFLEDELSLETKPEFVSF
jgi:hypothetical protein